MTQNGNLQSQRKAYRVCGVSEEGARSVLDRTPRIHTAFTKGGNGGRSVSNVGIRKFTRWMLALGAGAGCWRRAVDFVPEPV